MPWVRIWLAFACAVFVCRPPAFAGRIEVPVTAGGELAFFEMPPEVSAAMIWAPRIGGMNFPLSGLLIPSASATILMTAGFSLIRGQPLVQAAMRGILPATIGLSLAMAYQMGQPLLLRGYREGPARLGLQIAVIVAAGLLLARWGVSPLLVLMGGGGVTVILHMLVPVQMAGTAGQPSQKKEQA